MGDNTSMNNRQNNTNVPAEFDKDYINQSLEQFAHILYDYLIVSEKECQIKKSTN